MTIEQIAARFKSWAMMNTMSLIMLDGEWYGERLDVENV